MQRGLFDEDRKERRNDPPTYELPKKAIDNTTGSINQGKCDGLLVCDRCGAACLCADTVLLGDERLLDVDVSVYPVNERKVSWEQFENKIAVDLFGDEMDLGKHVSDNAGKQRKGKFKKRPFLKKQHIGPKKNSGVQAKILEFREAPKQAEYSDFIMDVVFLKSKKEFSVGLRSKTVLLDQLIEILGKRTEKWIGKTITLYRAGEEGEYINAR
jgi:hypothetical protein